MGIPLRCHRETGPVIRHFLFTQSNDKDMKRKKQKKTTDLLEKTKKHLHKMYLELKKYLEETSRESPMAPPIWKHKQKIINQF